MNEPNCCTCPHHYGPAGLERYAADVQCPIHGAPQQPAEVRQPTRTAPERDGQIDAPPRWRWEHGRGYVENRTDFDPAD